MSTTSKKRVKKLTHFVFASVWVRHRFVWSLFCWAYEQMPDVRCHCAPGGTFADTSPVVVVVYSAAVAACKHMQVMAGRRLSEENCKYTTNTNPQLQSIFKHIHLYTAISISNEIFNDLMQMGFCSAFHCLFSCFRVWVCISTHFPNHFFHTQWIFNDYYDINTKIDS